MTVPAVAQLMREGLELPAGATVLVGENGSGKSTVLEVLAAALGLNAEGGSVDTRHETRRSEPGSLDLIVERSPGADRCAYFLREEQEDPVLPTLRRLKAVPWTGPRSAPGGCARRGGPTWS